MNIRKNHHRTGNRSRSRPLQSGFTLIEALVAMVVMAFGMLGLAFLQAQGLNFNNTAYARTQATFAAYDIIDKIRINRIAALTGAYNATAAPGSFTDCDTTTCDTAEMAAFDLARWYAQLDYYGGNGSVVWDTANGYTITVQWAERRVRDRENQDPNEPVMQMRDQVWQIEL